MRQHQAILRQVVGMLQTKAVIAAGPFRYAYVAESPDLKHFVHPLTLSKLVLFVVSALTVWFFASLCVDDI